MERILLVHPNAIAADELAFVLQHSGFQVATADDEHQALTEISRKEPDVIIMAEALAKQNGDEPCIRLRERCKASIIILGQHREEGVGIHFLNSGADAYIPSPLNLRLLLARIHSLIRCYAVKSGDRLHSIRESGVLHQEVTK